MRVFKYKIDREQAWVNAKRWSIPTGLEDVYGDQARRNSRKPLSPELQKARADHMCELIKEGATYALVGKLYGLHRSRVRDIVVKHKV